MKKFLNFCLKISRKFSSNGVGLGNRNISPQKKKRSRWKQKWKEIIKATASSSSSSPWQRLRGEKRKKRRNRMSLGWVSAGSQMALLLTSVTPTHPVDPFPFFFPRFHTKKKRRQFFVGPFFQWIEFFLEIWLKLCCWQRKAFLN